MYQIPSTAALVELLRERRALTDALIADRTALTYDMVTARTAPIDALVREILELDGGE